MRGSLVTSSMQAPDANATDVTGRVDGKVSTLAENARVHKSDKGKTIQVSPAILEAARKSTEDVLQQLQTSAAGLSEAEAEQRADKFGPKRFRRFPLLPATRGRAPSFHDGGAERVPAIFSGGESRRGSCQASLF